jgi:hypothetical protein
VGITVGIAICFSFLRPYNTVVYAPKLRVADQKHQPPPLGKKSWDWLWPLWQTTEEDMVTLVGLDATVFMRFTRMCRNIFLVLTVLGCCVLLPVNYSTAEHFDNETWLSRTTPVNVWNNAQWALVAVAWVINIVVCGFLWWNYRKVLRLRRQYYESPEYQQSLHARTLMLYDIPKNMSTDEGIARIIDEVVPNSSFSRTAVARNVRILPELISEHDKAVRKLEKVLAKYLKDPQNLPAARPVCRPSKKDRAYDTYPKGQKVDAIQYWTDRIKALEIEIKEVRGSVDKRNAMSYGFASYSDISEAHAIAYTLRKKKPHGATVRLAPRPNDIIWDNLPLSGVTRARRRLWNNLWVLILTLLWVAPNAMIAIFLVNLGNLGKVWPAFQTSLEKDTGLWSVVQGIASPAVTSIVYLVLPIIFRRLSMRAGDQTKTGRERHVTGKLYTFFVFNNLIVFSVFSACWAFAAGVVDQTDKGVDAWQAIVKVNFGNTVFIALCNISTFWVTWLLQRQNGAAIDLAQLWALIYRSAMRRFSSPTPREQIELTAPPAFDYASYYNYFLYYSTVALTYAPIQPLVLPAAAIYFTVDVCLKKYLLLYVFVTKTESGGTFWRVLFNRMLFGLFLSNLIAFLVCWVRSDWSTHVQAISVAPLPFLLVAFKIVCARMFDTKMHFYSTRILRGHGAEEGLNMKEESQRNDRLAARFGHPALYKPLITPMVHAKAQNILASVYQGRLSDGRGVGGQDDLMSVSGYSDTYVLNSMAAGKPGKVSSAVPGFEMVPESRMDFEFYKNRQEFAEDHGGDGQLFGRASDIIRPGTPGSIFTATESRPGTPVGGMGFAGNQPRRVFTHDGVGTGYPGPYTEPSPYDSPPLGPTRTKNPVYNLNNDSGASLVHDAAGMPFSEPTLPSLQHARGDSPGPLDRKTSAPLGLGLGLGNIRAASYGYGGLPQVEDEDIATPPTQDRVDQSMSYDYFRGGRSNTRDFGNSGQGSSRNATWNGRS